MTDIDFEFFDADNHYYEVEDAFTRFGDRSVNSYVRWMAEPGGKRRHLFFGDQQAIEIPNPTFNPIAQAGAFHEHLRRLERGERPISNSMAAKYGELGPLPDTYQQRAPRLEAMDQQNVEKTLLYPTLGLAVEELMEDDPDMMYKVFHSFNTWLNNDWGFNYQGRMYAAPVIPLLDLDRAITELEYVLDLGAKSICLRPGPIYGRSPADPYFDPFFARINEAGTLLAYHVVGGPSAYHTMYQTNYCRPAVEDKGYVQMLERALFPAERPIMDTLMSLILGNFFGRFPKIHVASIENGATWVPYFLHSLDHAGGMLDRQIEAFGVTLDVKPSEVFKEKVWVSPFPEEDVVGLTELIGASQVLMGSDWPHPEGNQQPVQYAECLTTLDEAAIRMIMRDNALSLVGA